VLVDIRDKTLLLTGDAFGNDIVAAWEELELGKKPVKLDVLKMPHHGSIRNVTAQFIDFFQADNYVFSANGKFDNPDAETVEALVKAHGARNIVLHFTNGDMKWEKRTSYKLEKNGKVVHDPQELLKELKAAYGGKWSANVRKPADHSVVIELK
jgi:beta-lactamase superfamily II metal-dependent hydrolase